MSILRADSIKSSSGFGAPEFPNGIVVTGIVTASILQQNASFTGVTTFSNANFTSGFNVVGVVTHENWDTREDRRTLEVVLVLRNFLSAAFT